MANPNWFAFLFGEQMKHGVKKQIWLTKEESDLLQNYSEKTCLTEAGYIRMLLRGRVPKEKPDAEFYEIMNRVNQFLEQLQILMNQMGQEDGMPADILQEEIHRWHQFQLAIEERFLAPEKVPWL